MSTFPGTSAAVVEATTTRNRVLSLLVALAVALAVLGAPQFTTAASAHRLPHTPASSRIFATALGASANWSNFLKKVSSFIEQSRRWR